jgi:hypothetical protein
MGDQNNEQGIVDGCEIYGMSVAGLAFEHSNSLWHRVVDSYISGCASAVSNVPSGNTYTDVPRLGGSYSARGCVFTGNTLTTFKVAASRYKLLVDDCLSEGELGYAIYTPARLSGHVRILEVLNSVLSCGNPVSGGANNGVLWNSTFESGGDPGRLTLQNSRIFNGSGRVVWDFPADDAVEFDRCNLEMGTLRYAGRIRARDTRLAPRTLSPYLGRNGAPVGVIISEHLAMNQHPVQVSIGTSDLDTSLWSDRELVHVAQPRSSQIARLRNGFLGKEATLLFDNPTTTLVHGSNLRLAGERDWTPRSEATITLKCFREESYGPGGSVWYEISRKA